MVGGESSGEIYNLEVNKININEELICLNETSFCI